jgi:hypothetical protein
MLAMLVAGVLLLAVAGSGIAGGGGSSSRSSDEGTSGAPPAAQPQSGQGPVHHGRHCHHDGNRQAPQQSPTEAPPV